MSILPLKRQVVNRLVPFWATSLQLEWFSGNTEREKFEVVLQTTFVAFLGLWGSYFVSFVVGSPLATISGAFFSMNGLLRPIFLAYQRAVKVRGYDPEVPHIAGLFSGEVLSCETETRDAPVRVFEPSDRLVGSPLPPLKAPPPRRFESILRIQDESGRRLVVRAPRTKAHARVEPGMRVEVVIFAEGIENFDQVIGATDAYIPEAAVWFGSYPYLDRNEFKSFLAAQDRRAKARSSDSRRKKKKTRLKTLKVEDGDEGA